MSKKYEYILVSFLVLFLASTTGGIQERPLELFGSIHVEAVEHLEVESYVLKKESETMSIYDEIVEQKYPDEGYPPYPYTMGLGEEGLGIHVDRSKADESKLDVYIVSENNEPLTQLFTIDPNTVYSFTHTQTGTRVYINVVDIDAPTYKEFYEWTEVSQEESIDLDVLELSVGDYQYETEGVHIAKYDGQLEAKIVHYVPFIGSYEEYASFNVLYDKIYKFENFKTKEVLYFTVKKGAHDDDYTTSFAWVKEGTNWYYRKKDV